MTSRTPTTAGSHQRIVHRPLAPPELRGDSPHYPVLIVGGGPVGLAVAACLARFDIESVVIEKNCSAGEGSRAICLSRRSLEILDWIGTASPFVAKGLGWTRGRAFYRDRQIHELQMPHDSGEKFLPMTNLQQYYMEEFLAAHCAAQPAVQIRWGNALVDLSVGEDGITALIETQQGTYPLRCSYLIAADGARSQVRKLCGLSMSGASFAGRYLIADIRLRSEYPTERRAWFDAPSHPGSTVLMHKQPDDLWRIDYQLRSSEDEAAELQPQRVESRIQRHLDFIAEWAEWQLIWTSTYSARSLALSSYVHGRIMFAGDAAHLVPIFGVRGLNSGFADAHNLAWKLASVLQRKSDERLLMSYDQERRAATLEIHRQADKTTRFMTPTTRGDHLMRDVALSLAVDHPFARPLVDPRQSVPHTYVDSPLNSFDRPGPHDHQAFDRGPVPGAPLRNMRVRHARETGHLLDWIGTDFAGILFLVGKVTPDMRQLAAIAIREVRMTWLLVVDSNPVDVPALDELHAAHLEDIDRAAERLYGACAGALYLARPDGHVCARWKQVVPNEIASALRSARAQ